MLTVLNVAYSLSPVGPDVVGGSEQILWTLHEGLQRAGHRSVVVANEEPLPAVLTEEVKLEARERHREKVDRVSREEAVDIVHMHGLDWVECLPSSGAPVLATLHLPPAWYPPFPHRPDIYLNCVSHQQRSSLATNVRAVVIENGIVGSTTTPQRKRNYVAAMGRICPEKGFHHAMDAARDAGVDLVLAGEVFGYPEHTAYFEREIVPRLDRRRRFVGPVHGEKKRELLAGARALLIPSTVAETSSLVAMEAFASGTPVIAFRSGALPEIVEHGRTGLLVDNREEMARAIKAVEMVRSEDCLEVARTRFSSERMIRAYLAAYDQII